LQLSNRPQTSPTAVSPYVRWAISALLVPVLGGALAYTLMKNNQPLAGLPSAEVVRDIIPEQIAPLAVPRLANSSQPAPLGDTVEFVVRRNDTLDRIFRQLKLNLNDLANIRQLPNVRDALDRIRPGDKITVVHDDDAVQSVSHRVSESQVLSVVRNDDGFSAKLLDTPIEKKTAFASGEIDSSLFAAARSAGISADTVLRLANDIFGWDIDFALEIQPGDKFSVVYEQKYRDGNYIGDGRILAAEFVNAGESHRAVYFESADGQISGYYAPDGRSMRKQFLRAPLDFTRISSNFDPNRLHPILNTIRAHKGVDYAAPTGTLIKAAGDGRVSFVGMQGGYGRVVILEHGGGISTLYGHMSRFASAIHDGTRVKQGDVIGFVGMSGAATGPHLHYEYRVNGVHRNPRTVPLPNAAPIAAEYADAFRSTLTTLTSELDQHGQAPAATSVASTQPAR
jgi:murein DD-endopeptidase MepM/ murein hydrolase activator NlpD